MDQGQLRRIDELEKMARALQRDYDAAEERALSQLPPGQLELLFSRCSAERQGRPLSAKEWAAKQAFIRTVNAECQGLSPFLKRLFRRQLRAHLIQKGILITVGRTFSPEEIDLVIAGRRARKERRMPTDAEAAMHERLESLHQRLIQLAGFSSSEGMGEGGK